jgi:hypothetical protein
MRQELQEDSQMFRRAVDAVRLFDADDIIRRRLELARRRLIRSIVRTFRDFSHDELSTVVEYLQLMKA